MDNSPHAYIYKNSNTVYSMTDDSAHIEALDEKSTAEIYYGLRSAVGEVTFTAIWAPTVTIRYCTQSPKEVMLSDTYKLFVSKDGSRGYIQTAEDSKNVTRTLTADTTDPDALFDLLHTPINAKRGLHNTDTFGISRKGYGIAHEKKGKSWNKEDRSVLSGNLWKAELDWNGSGKSNRNFNENDISLQWISVLPQKQIEDFCNGISVAVNLYVSWVKDTKN